MRRSGEAEEGRGVGHCLLGEGWGDAAGGCVWIFFATISICFGAREMGKRKGKRHTFVILGSRLVDNGAVLEAAEVEHADTAVGAAGDEDVDAVGAEADVEDFFVVGDQLGLGCQSWDIPDRTGGVNRGCNDERWRDCIPIKRGERRSMLWCLGVGEEGKWCQFARRRRLMICASCDIIRWVRHRCICWQRP